MPWETEATLFSSLAVATTATASATSELGLVLFAETIARWEKVPTPSLVHVPNIGFLAGVLGFILVNQVHEEEPENK